MKRVPPSKLGSEAATLHLAIVYLIFVIVIVVDSESKVIHIALSGAPMDLEKNAIFQLL